MDKHLNTFYPYSSDEKTSFKEDNITRASLVTFDSLKNKEKIVFVNRLLREKKLSKFKKYSFVVELQSSTVDKNSNNELSIDLDSISKAEKYLVGFCPEGKVGETDDLNQIVESIYNSEIAHNARADGLIKVIGKNNQIELIILFENKLQPLFADQLHRHLSLLLGFNSKEEIKNAFKLYTYKDFFHLFNQKNSKYADDLLDFMNISGNLYPESFKDLKKIKFNRDENIEYLLSQVLIKIVNNPSTIKWQKGWGYTIRVNNPFIKMIGLIYKKDIDGIELCLKFAPTMRNAKSFYKSIIDPRKNSIDYSKYIGELHLGHHRGYVQKSYLCFPNSEQYVEYLLENNRLDDLKQGTLSDALVFVNGLIDIVIPDYDKSAYEASIKSDNRLLVDKVWVAPSLIYSKQWRLEDLYSANIDKFKDDILNEIHKCEDELGIKIDI